MLTMGNSIAKANTATCETHLLVVGGGDSGVSAAVQASRMGKETLIVEESTWLGGMLTAAGIKYDVGMEARANTGEEIAPERSHCRARGRDDITNIRANS